MTSIPVTICRFSDNNFKRLYIKKEWLFFDFLLHSEMCMKFRTFWKKRRVSYPNYSRSYCIRKGVLLKRLKGLTSAHHSVINVLTGSRHCWSQHGITIFLFFHEFEINWIGKCLPESHLKSSDILLTRSLPTTSIPVAISRFSDNNFKRFYLKKKTHFVDFWLHFWNVHEI